MDIAFDSLAEHTGIALPPLLRALILAGRTGYGENWRDTWRQRCLEDPPAFTSWYDFEWLDAATCRQTVDEWLNPAAQGGRRFLPFAQSGAGDMYCLMPYEGGVGVALVLHDMRCSELEYRSFGDFVLRRFLDTFVCLDHLRHSFSEAEAYTVVRSDLACLAPYLAPADAAYLQGFCQLPPTQHVFLPGPMAQPQPVLALMSQAQFDQECTRFSAPTLPPFEVVPRWSV
jgi:hypothetical protein